MLTWNAVSDTSGYELQFGSNDVRSNASQGGTFGGLNRNSEYTISVRAFNNSGVSDWSDPTSISTRPARPLNLRLSGAADARGHDSLAIMWDITNNPPNYDVEINGTIFTNLNLSIPATLGSPQFIFLPNQQQIVRIRARDDANGGVSFWSDHGSGQVPLDTVTRPNSPIEIQRVKIDMFSHGVRLCWTITAPSVWSAKSVLIRDEGGSPNLIHEELHTTNGVEKYAFNDLDYRYGSIRLYSIKIIVPRASVPGDVLGSDNESIDNPEVRVALLVSLMSNSKQPGLVNSESEYSPLSIGISSQPSFPLTSPWLN